MKTKKKIPWIWRRKTSCPSCGKVLNTEKICIILEKKKGFDCPFCGDHYAEVDFWDFNYEKYSLEADLSGEENE